MHGRLIQARENALVNPDLCSGSCLLRQAAWPTPQTTQLLFNSLSPSSFPASFCRIIIDATHSDAPLQQLLQLTCLLWPHRFRSLRSVRNQLPSKARRVKTHANFTRESAHTRFELVYVLKKKNLCKLYLFIAIKEIKDVNKRESYKKNLTYYFTLKGVF